MAQINKPTDYFNTKLYSGTGSAQSITGVNFQPDLVWIKGRNNGNYHRWFDVVRGVPNYIGSNATDAEASDATQFTSFDSDGFTLSTGGATNGSGYTFASWNWLANGTGSSNTDGSITSTVSANTTSGFSIVSYTGTGSAATVGHGLSTVPKMIILKDRTSIRDWFVYHNSIGNNNRLKLNDTVASGATTIWNTTTPTSSVFSISNEIYVNDSGNNYIAYCFAEKKGFSKFGSYTGNGNADGTFVYTGFKPAFIIVKSTGVQSWFIYDNKRLGYNENNYTLLTNGTNTEISGEQEIDILSNGFKMRSPDSPTNASGQSFIYMAFAENPLVGTNNIPATAR